MAVHLMTVDRYGRRYDAGPLQAFAPDATDWALVEGDRIVFVPMQDDRYTVAQRFENAFATLDTIRIRCRQ